MQGNGKQFRVLKMVPSSATSEVLLATDEYTLIAPTGGTATVLAMGVRGLAEITFELELRAGRYEVVSVTAKPPPGEPLDFEELRSAKRRAQWVRDSVASAVWVHAADGSVYDAEHQIPDADPYLNVMLTYTIAKAFGQEPVAAVAEHLGIGREAASQRVYRARKLGLLPPATGKGKA